MKRIKPSAGLTALLLAGTCLTAPLFVPQVAVAEVAAEASSPVAGPLSPAVAGVTAPVQFFPQEPGTDFYLANHDQYEAYLKLLAQQSDRMKLESFGTTEEGRTQWMAIVSTPENLANLDRYKDIARRLAKAEGVSEEEARQLAADGKAVVWIDAGLHATETVTTQGQIHVLYRLLTGQDAETLRTLDDTILLFGHANPDGLQLVADWYMRKEDPQERSFRDIPVLYQKYTGHDNNRDSYMVSQAETANIARVHYREWFPQIVYNQHQTGPRGMVVYIPPFRDPYNYNLDGLVMNMTSELGTTMHSRLVAEGKGGSGSNSVGAYSTWHNGMVRSTPYYHNAIGILTELIGGPTPEDIALIPDVQLARNDIPLPMVPRRWHLRDSIDYQWSMNRAIIDYASRNKERLLFNIWRMGQNAIERGSTDTWQMTPTLVEALKAAGNNARAVDPSLMDTVVRTAENRMPRGYIINPQTQRDLPTTVAFLNTLIKNGVDVEVAERPFTVNGTRYPAGSYVVKTAQAYRPHVLDMFEPQDHPHNTEYPGGPPKLPYDVAGYTLAFQMGVNFDRIQDGFEAPTVKAEDVLAPPPGRVIGNGRAGFVIGHEENNSFILTNRLLAAGIQPEWIEQSVRANGETLGAGAIWVPASEQAAAIIREAVGPLGIDAHAVSRRPAGEGMALKPVRVGLVDRYGGVMSSGWTRFLLERYEFPFEVVYPQALDTEDLNAKYDVLVFTDTVAPALDHPAYRQTTAWPQPKPETIPAEMRGWLGEVTAETTVPRIAEFARKGGTVVTIGNSNRLAHLLGAPIEPALVKTEGERVRPLPNTEFFLPGSILSAKVEAVSPLAYGMPERADVFFNNGQTFRVTGEGARTVVRFDSDAPLRSGWAHNQEILKDTSAVVEADLGEGKLFAYGAEVIQRAQPHGTFRLFFNGLLYGPASANR
ncbi:MULTISPECIES: M14 family metallopeptidase [unclassified Brevundimonas]|uniref:M14 family metallopeptidase n=1 Tax=unclassified Brevundimonas TaxID=2622653 RepID=UPI0025BDBF1E|nr:MULTISPECIES: M14 metallopeptidase family protein [unclassified Brevundimonas]